jgi:hypothetical protein
MRRELANHTRLGTGDILAIFADGKLIGSARTEAEEFEKLERHVRKHPRAKFRLQWISRTKYAMLQRLRVHEAEMGR